MSDINQFNLRIIDSCIMNVFQMHEKYSLPINLPSQNRLSTEVLNLRIKLLTEEYNELRMAKTVEDVIDALIDLAYVACGNVITLPTKKYTCNYELEYEHCSALNVRIIEAICDAVYAYTVFSRSHAYEAASQTCLKLISFITSVFNFAELNFIQHWKVVHLANMAKIKSSIQNPSSRGDTTGMDLVKPEGWQGPNHNALLQGVKYDSNFNSLISLT